MNYRADTQSVLLCAAEKARNLGHSYVGSMHLLLAIAEERGIAGQFLCSAGMEAQTAADMVILLHGIGTPGLPLPQGLSIQAKRVLRGAGIEASHMGMQEVVPAHILLSILRLENTAAKDILVYNGIDTEVLFSKTIDYLNSQNQSPVKGNKEAVTTRLLEQFGEDLVQKSTQMEPVIGREREIDMVIGILSRKNKNNPALIGEPGVGKTAIAEGLAQRMAVGNVPPQLKNKRLVSLNMSNLVAGTKYRGEFEERLRDVLAEIRRSADIILFVDEMHTIVGAGAAEGAIDAANIFKPALGRGELQILGATTLMEYHKYIEKDPALDRRFRPVMVEEPDNEATMTILKGLRPGLERHHHMRISEEALKEALRMSVRYLPDLYLPDKAIDLLDEAASHAHIEQIYGGKHSAKQELEAELHEAVRESQFEKAAQLRDKMQRITAHSAETRRTKMVTATDIAWAVSARTGIPVGRLTANERERLLNLEKNLSGQVIGQEEAIEQVSETVRRGLCSLRDVNRPIACMLLTGPTGVGKTELCKALAQELYGSREAMIRLDMSEYMEKHSVARLIGAPPGYVGYEEGGKLTEAVRRRPYCLVLLDELEKAHPDIAGILLQIMEEGTLTDSSGRHVSFKNVILVMTSNVGGEERGNGLGFQPVGHDGKVKEALQKRFSPEFLGRLDKIVYFQPLQQCAMEGIVRKYLRQIQERASAGGIQLAFSEDVAQSLGSYVEKQGGARQIRKIVQDRVEGPLSVYLLKTTKKPGSIQCCMKNGFVEIVE